MPAIKAIPTVKTVAVRPADKVRSLPAPPAQSAVERLANSGAALPPPVETASVNPPAKAEGPQAAVQLGTGPSVDSLRLNWTLLSQRHQGVLQKLQPRYTARGDSGNGSAGAAYDLIAGPVSTSAEAQRICDALRAQNVSCKVGAFGGNAL